MRYFFKYGRFLFFPLSILYSSIVTVRNWLFDIGWKKSVSFDIPVIVVGNLKVGGTGKTPSAEFLIKLLKEDFKVALLSRGYKRKTTGFKEVFPGDDVTHVGDESFQVKQKFSDVIVAVDENRVNGINTLLKKYPDVDVVLLDDAYQHRYVKPGLSILLTEYNNPYFSDCMLPVGMLRENRKGKKRAGMFLITKSPDKNLNEDWFVNNIKPDVGQQVYFSGIRYKQPLGIWNSKLIDLNNFEEFLLVVGIANPEPLEKYLENYGKVKVCKFPDHHNFTQNELLKIENEFEHIKADKKIIITTEKDAVRLKSMANMSESLRLLFYYIPIEFAILGGKEKVFNEQLISYVKQNKRER